MALKKEVHEFTDSGFKVNGHDVTVQVIGDFNKQNGRFKITNAISTLHCSPSEVEFEAFLTGRVLPLYRAARKKMLELRAEYDSKNADDDSQFRMFDTEGNPILNDNEEPDDDEDDSDNDHQPDANVQLSFAAPKKSSNAKQVAVPAGENDGLDF